MRGLTIVVGIGTLLLAAAGCDRTPTETHVALVTVEAVDGAVPPGAALVYFPGGDAGGAEPVDGSTVWGHSPSGEEGSLRVVVVHPGSPTVIRFSVEWTGDPSGRPGPTLLSVADQENEPVADLSGYRVRVSPSTQ